MILFTCFHFLFSLSFKNILACRRNLEQSGAEESLSLEGTIGGGLVLQRKISIMKDNPKILIIDSGIVARSVGAGSGGFSRYFSISHANSYHQGNTNHYI